MAHSLLLKKKNTFQDRVGDTFMAIINLFWPCPSYSLIIILKLPPTIKAKMARLSHFFCEQMNKFRDSCQFF